MHYYKRNLGDYAKKAGRLTMLQHGSYTLLIDACYDREQFPTMDEAIEWTWASSTAEIEAVQFVLRKFFTLEGEIYVQCRIREEIAEYHSKSEINQRIAIERETKRKANSTKRAPVVNEPPPNQEPLTNNQEPVKRKTSKSATPSALPDWVPADAWSAFVAMRKAIKKPLADSAIPLAVAKLDKLRAAGCDPRAVLEQSTLNSWQGLFEVKHQVADRPAGPAQQSAQRAPFDLRAAQDAANAEAKRRLGISFDDGEVIDAAA